jgi:hypothetical protein
MLHSPTTAAGPLHSVLHTAADWAADEAVRAWLTRLLRRGESARGETGRGQLTAVGEPERADKEWLAAMAS